MRSIGKTRLVNLRRTLMVRLTLTRIIIITYFHALRKTCHNYGNTNHLVHCKKNIGINSIAPKSGLKSRLGRFDHIILIFTVAVL